AGDARQEVLGGELPQWQDAQRPAELELTLRRPVAPVLPHVADRLHHLPLVRAVGPLQLVAPDGRRVYAPALVAEREDDEGVALVGLLLGAVEDQELVLDAVADGNASEVERRHDTGKLACRGWWGKGGAGRSAGVR